MAPSMCRVADMGRAGTLKRPFEQGSLSRRRQPPACAQIFAAALRNRSFGVMVDRERSPDEIALDFVAGLCAGTRAVPRSRRLRRAPAIQSAGKPDHRADDRRRLRVGSRLETKEWSILILSNGNACKYDNEE